MSNCTGDTKQQFLTAGEKPGKKAMHYTQSPGGGSEECLTVPGGRFAPMTPLVSAQGGACAQAPAISRDKLGRLVARHKGASLCVRPDSSVAHRSAHGVLADWRRLDGRTLDITADQTGNVFGVGRADGKVYVAGAGGWKPFVGTPPDFIRLDAGIVNEIWAIGKSGNIHHFYGKWRKVTGGSTDIAAGGPNASIVASLDSSPQNTGKGGHGLWVTTDKAKTWTRTKGHGVRVDVDGAGGLWIVQNQGWVWHRHHKTKKWTKMPTVPGGAKDISAGMTGTIMVTTLADDIYVLSGDHKKWQQFPGMGVNIAVGPSGSPVVGVDVGTHKGIVFAHNSHVKAKGWKSVPLLDAFAPTTGQVSGKRLVLDTCDPKPVTKTWSTLKPKSPGNFAKMAGMTEPFRLEHENFYGAGARRAVGFVGSYQWHGRTQAIAHPLPLDLNGRQEMVAVFKDDAKKFAMYNKALGLCMVDQKGAPYGESRWASFEPCNFSNRQLWTRKPARTKGRYFLHNVQTKRCLVPSLLQMAGGVYGGFEGVEGLTPLKDMVVRLAEPSWNICNPNTVPGWIMAPYTRELVSQIWYPAARFNGNPVVQLQVQKGLMCVDATTNTNNGATAVAWSCIRGQNKQQFKVTRVGNNQFTLKSQQSGKCLGIKGGSLDYDTPVDQWGCANLPHQRWKLQDQGSGWFQLINYRTGACLGLGRDIASNGEWLSVNKCKRDDHMFFRIINN